MSAAMNPGLAVESEPNPVVEAAEAAAVLSPKPQSWQAREVDRGIEIRVPSVGRAPAGGLALRTALITTGRALFTMRLALANRGYRPVTTLAPHPNRPAVVAVLRYGAAAAPTPDERSLYAALAGERYPMRVVAGAALLPMLRRAAEIEGAWLRAADTPAERDALAARLSDELALKVQDPEYLPILLGTHHDEQPARLQAGEAAQRVVLTASALGHDAVVSVVPVAVTPTPATTPPFLERGLAPQALILVRRRRGWPPVHPRY